ncbi:Ku protein [Actinokineospora globicatena]|uniref:Non-homologous end joining protein Ku n=1 Tax=Actinokineospora globicatena TaxID=103729 RepID=A0A9W6QJQ5_9PSEU|nr:Ku protein [Actinokineospora globicatena]MCP2304462.1 DNA end-binding protein Ku [Actinokineospora globicatena]GLW78172.1 non-homologous end joining protein Ku [Actinokineospora globicatena]GLW85162.1 non-homologous end joining protein Ku [Actinokineospora globicatena]GLW90777.1 non-homologous end joining protein Ku [Actinokineospora globicatena]
MARPIWHGAINFGLVTVPVDLYGATEDHTISFRQFERGTSDRIRYKRVNERTGAEVAFADIVKGAEVGGGEYVIIEPEELDEIAPGRSRTIDISSFVALEEIDPIHFQKTYWLAPSKEEYGKAYGLLLQAMRKTNRAGVATFVMRGKEYLTAIRAGDDDLLLLTTMLFVEDLRDPAKELKSLPEITPARGKELDMAITLVDSMTEQWNPADYHDTYTQRVEKLIDDKKAGREVVVGEEPSSPTKVVDLFEALSKSVESRKTRRPTSPTPSDDLDTLSKADLDKLARELDIKGRSKMTRDELQKAVAATTRRAS